MKKTESRGGADGTPYRPISCDVYSELELAILHKTRLRLAWCEGNVRHTHLVMPLDLQTRAHQEWLRCRLESGEEIEVRLDRILRSEPA